MTVGREAGLPGSRCDMKSTPALPLSLVLGPALFILLYPTCSKTNLTASSLPGGTGRGCISIPTERESWFPEYSSLDLHSAASSPSRRKSGLAQPLQEAGPSGCVCRGQSGSDKCPQEWEGCLPLWRRVNPGSPGLSTLPPSSKPVESFNQVGC